MGGEQRLGPCRSATIYSGIASPTDAAAVGVLLALILSWYTGSLSRQTFLDGLMGATKTSCMIAFILAGAAFLTVAMGFTGIPKMLAVWISGLHLSPYALLGALTLFFIIMGCFLDGISVVVLTTSVVMPMVKQAGIDPLWFGIFVVIVVEMAQITPPVGFNLFVIQGLTGMDILKVAYAAAPFFGCAGWPGLDCRHARSRHGAAQYDEWLKICLFSAPSCSSCLPSSAYS